MGSFQRDFRRSLVQYALVPLLAIAVLGAALGAWGWHRDVAEQSEATRSVAADALGRILAGYEERLELAAGRDVLSELSDATARRELYEWLYHEVSIAHDGTQFFFVSPAGEVLVGSKKELPAYLRNPGLAWGIWARLKAAPGRTAAEFSPREAIGNSDLILGRAALREGEVVGYWLFVLDGDYLARAVSSPQMDFILADGFDHASILTNKSLRDERFLTVPAAVAGQNHVTVRLGEEDYYVTGEALSVGDFRLYSLMSVTALEARYETAALLLLAVLALMVPIILWRARRESLARARESDDLLAAFAALKKGDLKSKLRLSGDDFAIVERAYNHMVESLEALMAQNEARARASAISEVRQLEAQFHPHFIFNTLENIKFMIKLDPDAAMQMIVSLSAILRYGIKNLSSEVTLAEDLGYAEEYLKIMKQRFGRRLTCAVEIPEELKHAFVPKLIFQPILENAIKYGEAADGTITVRLNAWGEAGRLMIAVENDGPPLAEEKLKELRELLAGEDNFTRHTGIYNVHRRLRLLYGAPCGLTLDCPKTCGTRVTLTLPLRIEGK